MDKLQKMLIGGSIIAVLLLIVIFKPIDIPVGSVSVGSSYQSVNMTAITGSTTTGTLIKAGSRTLGSVIFTATSAQTITLYDVAVGDNYASTTLSTKIISFATSTPAGTYTFDLNAFKGIVVFAPITPTVEGTITWR